MTVREYLSQGYRLEQRLEVSRNEIAELQALACSVSSPGFEEHYNSTRNTDAPFVRTVERIMKMQDRENQQLNLLLTFKEEAKGVIDAIENKDERMVLYHRYLGNATWLEIADILDVDERTIRRWHNKALSHAVVPENPTIIDKFLED